MEDNKERIKNLFRIKLELKKHLEQDESTDAYDDAINAAISKMADTPELQAYAEGLNCGKEDVENSCDDQPSAHFGFNSDHAADHLSMSDFCDGYEDGYAAADASGLYD